MPGYYNSYFHKTSGFMPKTKDLSTNIGFIFFEHKDMNVLNKNYERIKKIEEDYINNMYYGIELI